MTVDESKALKKGTRVYWPISGGSTICGKSGDKVCVRSTTRTRPEASSATNCKRTDSLIWA